MSIYLKTFSFSLRPYLHQFKQIKTVTQSDWLFSYSWDNTASLLCNVNHFQICIMKSDEKGQAVYSNN